MTAHLTLADTPHSIVLSTTNQMHGLVRDIWNLIPLPEHSQNEILFWKEAADDAARQLAHPERDTNVSRFYCEYGIEHYCALATLDDKFLEDRKNESNLLVPAIESLKTLKDSICRMHGIRKDSKQWAGLAYSVRDRIEENQRDLRETVEQGLTKLYDMQVAANARPASGYQGLGISNLRVLAENFAARAPV